MWSETRATWAQTNWDCSQRMLNENFFKETPTDVGTFPPFFLVVWVNVWNCEGVSVRCWQTEIIQNVPIPPGNGWEDAHRAERWYFIPPHSKRFYSRVLINGFIHTFLSDLSFILNCKDSHWELSWYENAHITVIAHKKKMIKKPPKTHKPTHLFTHATFLLKKHVWRLEMHQCTDPPTSFTHINMYSFFLSPP